MINITDKSLCCGCNACGDICPSECITFQPDNEGFLYPIVNKELCIDCNLCVKICPHNNVEKLKAGNFEEPECHAAIHKNIEIRFDSTSGGVFSALAEKMYKDGGYVGGAVYTEGYGVKQFISANKSDLSALRSSKYLQSDAQGFYKTVKELALSGEKILVCGTPCQMAALRNLLPKKCENVIFVDFICRGINSPKFFRKYLDFLESEYNSEIIYLKSKNKEIGWRQLTTKIVFKNGKVLYDTRDTSITTIAYLKTGVLSRPACYSCPFKGFPRIADITVADYWGAEKTVGKDLDNDMGTSLVMLNTLKGKNYYNEVKTFLNEQDIPFASILEGNVALTKPLDPPLVDRTEFYNALDNANFKDLINKYVISKNNISLKRKIKNILVFVKRVIKVSRFNFRTLYQNIKYNCFVSNIHNSVSNGSYMLINRNTVIELQKNSEIHINGVFIIGNKKNKKLRKESFLLLQENAILKVDNDFIFGAGADIEIFSNATLHLAGKSATNINTTIICADLIYVGERTMIGRNVTIRDNNGNHYIARRGYKDTKPIIIDQHTWLCEGCTILVGAKIGTGAIIGAKAVVSGKIPAFSLSVGNPAKVIDEDVYWKY